MDERKAQLKRLKKISNQAKHRYFTVWKVLALVFLCLGILGGLGGAVAQYMQLSYFLYILYGAAGSLVLYIVMLFPWGAGKKRWKKSEEYLNYRTMKRAVRDEKRMR